MTFYNTFGSHNRFKGKDEKTTTLTIVQDFPKKKPEVGGDSIEMVQGKEHNVHIVNADEAKPTTLTIVQDFPKKQAPASAMPELVQHSASK